MEDDRDAPFLQEPRRCLFCLREDALGTPDSPYACAPCNVRNKAEEAEAYRQLVEANRAKRTKNKRYAEARREAVMLEE